MTFSEQDPNVDTLLIFDSRTSFAYSLLDAANTAAAAMADERYAAKFITEIKQDTECLIKP